MILLIDNYDSFSYNLYQLVGAVNPDIRVMRNDAVTVEEIRQWKPELLILSPGPGRPENAGICVSAVKELAGEIPIFGVCLGHQAICQAFGAAVTYAKQLMHGKTSLIRVDTSSRLFRGMEEEILVGRYHSLAVDPETLPDCLAITARTKEGEIMAVEHKAYPVYGVQFHPESILTTKGRMMIEHLLYPREDER